MRAGPDADWRVARSRRHHHRVSRHGDLAARCADGQV